MSLVPFLNPNPSSNNNLFCHNLTNTEHINTKDISSSGVIKSNIISDQDGNVIITPTSITSGTIVANSIIRCPSITDLSGNSLIQDIKHFTTSNNFSQTSENADVDIGDSLSGTITTASTNIGVFNSDVFKVIGSKITINNMVLLSLVNTSSDMNGNTGHGLPFISSGVLNANNGQGSGYFYVRIGNADNASINSKTFTIRFLIIE